MSPTQQQSRSTPWRRGNRKHPIARSKKAAPSARQRPFCDTRRWMGGEPGVSVDGILEALAGLELRLSGRLDRHRLAGARVAAGRCLALGDRASAETDQANFLALRQRAGDSVENAFDRLRRVTARKTAGLG